MLIEHQAAETTCQSQFVLAVKGSPNFGLIIEENVPHDEWWELSDK